MQKVELQHVGVAFNTNEHYNDEGESARPLHKQQQKGYLKQEQDLDRLKYYNTWGNILVITLAFMGLYALYISVFIVCWVASIMPGNGIPAEIAYIILWIITGTIIIVAGIYGRIKKRKSMQKEAMYADKEEINFDMLKA